MSAARRIGILGGTFDPIHRGHVDLGRAAEATLGLDPAVRHPRERAAAPAADRTPPRFTALRWRRWWSRTTRTGAPPISSCAVRRPSYTAVTLQQFHDRGYSPSELFFIIGADAFAELATWRAYPQILDWAHFAVVSRPGHPTDALPARLPTLASRMVRPPRRLRRRAGNPLIILIDAPTADVSSTAIRERRAAGETIAGLVTPGVETHIEQHGLYAALLPITPGIPWTPGRRRNDPPSDAAAGRLHGQG